MTGNRPKGFKPDAKEGNMFDKKAFGLHVPAEEEFDAMNQSHLVTRNGKALPTDTGAWAHDGYTKIDAGRIGPAVQDQYNDAGKVKPTHPSRTFSGHARGRKQKK